MELWSKEFISEITFLKYCSFDSLDDVINRRLGQKGPKPVIYATMVTERWKSIARGNLRLSSRFWNHYFKMFKFWLSVVASTTQKWVKKIQIGISCNNVNGRIKIKSKRYFWWIIRLWNCSFHFFSIIVGT